MESQDKLAAENLLSTPDARDDLDVIPGPNAGPATGNTITGAGTVTGASGSDSTGSPAAVVTEVQGAGGGSAAGAGGGSMQAAGRYGVLDINPQGDFTYTPSAGTQPGVQDVFRYT